MTLANTSDNEAYVDPVEAGLRNAGLKATLARKQVLEIIRSSELRHLSAEDIYRRLLDQGFEVGLTTIYRVLAELERAGLLSRNVFDGGKAMFEIKERGRHDHLICLGCGRVDEFRNRAINALRREIAAKQGYELAVHQLALYGHCKACTEARPRASLRLRS